jgi:hypothetical protein
VLFIVLLLSTVFLSLIASQEILVYCSPAKCIKLEQKYINLLKPEYNILKIAGSSLGKTHSEETRAAISAAMKSIALGRNKNHNSISNLTLGRRKMIKISVLDLETNISTVYNSIGAAAKALNIPQTIISQYFIKNQYQKKPYKKRYVFRKC